MSDTKPNSAMRKIRVFDIMLLSLTLLILGNSKPASAQYFSGPKANAMGGAGRAAGESEGHILNPASLSHLKRYYIDGGYRYHSLEEKGGVRDWSVNLADGGTENYFRGAFAYVNSDKKIGGQLTTEEDYILSVGGPISEGVSLGLQGQRWSQRPPYQTELVIYQLTFGALYTPIENFGVGFVSYNMLDDHEPLLRPELALGLHYIYEPMFRFRGDISYPTKYNPSKKGIIMLGTETVFSSGFRPRIGLKIDDVDKKSFATLGLGWEGPKFAVNYSIEKDVRTAEQHRQSFDLNLLF